MVDLSKAPPTPSGPVHQHTVSRVVLKQWAVAGDVEMFTLHGGEHRPRGIKGQGKVDGYVRFGAEETERRWKEIEDRAPATLDAARDGSFLDDPVVQRDLRNLVLLHALRSRDSRVMWSNATDTPRLDELRELIEQPFAGEAVFEHVYGLEAAGPEAVAIGHEILAGWVDADLGPGGTAFESSLVENFERALEHFATASVDIGTLVEGELLIGDNPAVSVNRTTGQVGLRSGAKLDEADTILMPIDPTHVAALSTTPRTSDISKDVAVWINRTQISVAHERVWSRPGASLADLVEETQAAASAGRSSDQTT